MNNRFSRRQKTISKAHGLHIREVPLLLLYINTDEQTKQYLSDQKSVLPNTQIWMNYTLWIRNGEISGSMRVSLWVGRISIDNILNDKYKQSGHQ